MEWVYKMWYAHLWKIIQLYEKGMLTQTTAGKDLAAIMLREMSQSRKDKSCMVTLP